MSANTQFYTQCNLLFQRHLILFKYERNRLNIYLYLYQFNFSILRCITLKYLHNKHWISIVTDCTQPGLTKGKEVRFTMVNNNMICTVVISTSLKIPVQQVKNRNDYRH